jgi:hypothetical protein
MRFKVASSEGVALMTFGEVAKLLRALLAGIRAFLDELDNDVPTRT